jgi:hypothetical protein
MNSGSTRHPQQVLGRQTDDLDATKLLYFTLICKQRRGGHAAASRATITRMLIGLQDMWSAP